MSFKDRGYLQTIPFFDEPSQFLAVASSSSINLINLEMMTMQPLIVADLTSLKGQQAFFFLEEEYGMSINFAHRDANNKYRVNWSKVPYKKDFFEHLQKYGLLPITTTQDLLEL